MTSDGVMLVIGDVSLLGWPFIYLQRSFDTLPQYLAATRVSDWPLPIDADETREMNYGNLLWDLLISGAIVVVCYFVVRGLVFRYDRWKKTWAD
jgi:hypothetical protein